MLFSLHCTLVGDCYTVIAVVSISSFTFAILDQLDFGEVTNIRTADSVDVVQVCYELLELLQKFVCKRLIAFAGDVRESVGGAGERSTNT